MGFLCLLTSPKLPWCPNFNSFYLVSVSFGQALGCALSNVASFNRPSHQGSTHGHAGWSGAIPLLVRLQFPRKGSSCSPRHPSQILCPHPRAPAASHLQPLPIAMENTAGTANPLLSESPAWSVSWHPPVMLQGCGSLKVAQGSQLPFTSGRKPPALLLQSSLPWSQKTLRHKSQVWQGSSQNPQSTPSCTHLERQAWPPGSPCR
jgi:hypothetical protein